MRYLKKSKYKLKPNKPQAKSPEDLTEAELYQARLRQKLRIGRKR